MITQILPHNDAALNQAALLLGDIANIVDGFEETPSGSINGKPAFVEVNASAIRAPSRWLTM